MSEPRSVTLLSASLFGVPQALALAPTLFFFFCNSCIGTIAAALPLSKALR